MSEDKVGAQSSESAELGLRERKKTGVPVSSKEDCNTTQDNQEASICPEPVVIQALDLALARKIRSSTESDPLVLRALEGLKIGSPLFPCSSMDDWHMTNGHLYFKGHMYIPPHEQQAIVRSIHDSPTTGHAGRFWTKALLERDFWWPGLSSFVNAFISGCAICQQNKVNHHPTRPTCPHSLVLHPTFQTTIR